MHQSAVIKNNPLKAVRSVGDGETVEFDIVEGEKGNEAANVTGPNGEPVKGHQFARYRRSQNTRRTFFRGGRGGFRPRGQGRRSYYGSNSGGLQRFRSNKEDSEDAANESESQQQPREGPGGSRSRGSYGPPRRYFNRQYKTGNPEDFRNEGGYGGGGYRQGGPRRYYRRSFGSRGREHPSQDNGDAGEEVSSQTVSLCRKLVVIDLDDDE